MLIRLPRFACRRTVHCVSKKNDTDVAHYNFNVREPILVIFGRDVARRRGLGVLGRSGPVEYS